MHDLAQALRAELAELSIDGHASAHVNRGERGVCRFVNRAFIGDFFVVINAARRVRVSAASRLLAFNPGVEVRAARTVLRLALLGEANQSVLRRRERAGQHLQLVGLVQTQREGVAPRVPFPLAEGHEACAAREALAVVCDDALRLTA